MVIYSYNHISFLIHIIIFNRETFIVLFSYKRYLPNFPVVLAFVSVFGFEHYILLLSWYVIKFSSDISERIIEVNYISEFFLSENYENIPSCIRIIHFIKHSEVIKLLRNVTRTSTSAILNDASRCEM